MARRGYFVAVLALLARPGTAATWTTIGPPGGIAMSAVFAPSDGSIAYAALMGGGVFRSKDGGATWTPASGGLASLRTAAVAIDPADANVVYAGAYRGKEAAGGVFKTSDGGAAWVPVNSGLSVLDITKLAVDPAAHETVYAGTVFGGIFRTTDGGASWHDISSGKVAGATVVALVVDSGSNVTASVIPNGNGTPALVRSTDGGAVWQAAGAGLPDSLVTAIAPRPGSSSALLAGTVAAGIFRSSDGGGSWTPSTSGFPPGRAAVSLAYDAVDPTVAYAGDDHRFVFRSVDGGATWTVGKPGSPPGVVAAIAVSPSAHVGLAATTDAGILRSDGGAHWFPSNFGLEAQEIDALAIDPGKDRTVYAAGAVGGLSVTTNGGATWQRIDAGLPEILSYDDGGWAAIEVAAIAVDPATPSTIYAGLNTLGPANPPAGGGLYKSTDSGATWHAAMAGMTDGSFEIFIGHLAIDPAHPSTVYAAAEGRGLFRSGDAGAHWSPGAGLPFAFVNGVVVDPGNPAIVLAVTSAGLYRSTDSGNHFGPSSTGFADSFAARAFAFDPARPDRIFAGTFHGEIFTSEDGGASWTQTSAEMSPHGITALAWAPGTGTLWAATEDDGIFRSGDRGAHWTAASDGLPTLRVRTLANRIGSDVVYAGLYGGGVAVTGDTGPRGRGPILPVPPPRPGTIDRDR